MAVVHGCVGIYGIECAKKWQENEVDYEKEIAYVMYCGCDGFKS